MLTWATGRSTDFRASSAPLSAGFTLVELLVVVAIVGIIIAGAVLSLGLAGEDRRLVREAERLARTLEHASSTAILRGVRVALEFYPEGYRGSYRHAGKWIDFAHDNHYLRPHEIDLSLRLIVASASGTGERLQRFEFDPEGTADPVEITLYQDDTDARANLSLSALAQVSIDYQRSADLQSSAGR